jgi:putative ABC transport system permease protein
MAILAIIALGVGFFVGLKMTKPSMMTTISNFYQDKNFFDLHLLSTVGFTDDNVNSFSKEDDVKYAEGIYSLDLIYQGIGDSDNVLKTLSMPENVNGIELAEGRMPEKDDECVVDSKLDDVNIGDKIILTEDNDEDSVEELKYKEYTITGTVMSSYYINFERGTTTLGNGKVSGFVYIPRNAFDLDYYTDVFVKFDEDFELYSDEYDNFMDEKETEWDEICKEQVEESYKQLLISYGMPDIVAETKSIDDTDLVAYYVLNRGTNIGYACFESDSEIVNGVSKVFPIFFILVAVLVCMTTMNRMVEEQRTMIGMFKALGYGEGTIMAKYMIYSGSAALIGCVVGYVVGMAVFPPVIWFAYKMMYIDIPLVYAFDLKLIIAVVLVALVCTVGTTWLTCRYELYETAANLMRPKAPKAGKRVFLEKIPFVWNKMKFLKKVSVRNIFRYKKRLFMMIIGISGCTALLLTGFGINDSIAGFADTQFDEIQVYDGSIVLSTSKDSVATGELVDELSQVTESYDFVYESSWDLTVNNSVKTVNLVAPEKTANFGKYLIFKDSKGNGISYPEKNQAVINNAIADDYDIEVGDEIIVRNSDMDEIKLTVSGIFENHVYNYVFISPETYEEQLGGAPEYASIYFNLKSGLDAHEELAKIMAMDGAASVTINQDSRQRVSQMMNSLNYIILVVILAAAALAFIVLYNLTNINITERIREIATIKVLGFFKNETASYVFRENRVLTAIGIIVGLGLGVLLHSFVMSQIKVDMVSFDVYISPLSYIYSIILTFVFNFGVNIIMSRKLENINMAESLKSVD